MLDAATRPLVVDTTTVVPDPFDLQEFIHSNLTLISELPKGLNLFHNQKMDHPDGEFEITICGGFEEDNVVVEYVNCKFFFSCSSFVFKASVLLTCICSM